MSALLHIQNLSLAFAGIKALNDVSLEVQEGSLSAVIGPNGAGKTSLYNCISGVYKPNAGQVVFKGQDITSQPAHARASLGIARMFQNLALFDNLTTLENLLVGCHHAFKTHWWQDLLHYGAGRKEEIAQRAKAEAVIDFLNLAQWREWPVGMLPYGVRKRIELGRALCMEPTLLLLDEPAAGLNQEETEELARYLLDIRQELHISLLLIEHDLGFVMNLADHISVLDFGQKIAEGPPATIRQNPFVIQAYMGHASATDDALSVESSSC